MAIHHDLTLPEQVLLLALGDDAGTIPMGSMYAHAIAGAIIAELALHERIAVEEHRKSDLITIIDERPTGDPLLDESLEKIRTARRRASAATWVGRLAGLRARDPLAERLQRRGILRREEGRLLLIFPRRKWPTVDPRPEADLITRMRAAIFDGRTPDVRTAVLIGLAYPAGLLNQIFEKSALKQHKGRIEEIASGAAISEATRAAVESAIEAATAAMVAMTTLTAVTTAT